MKEYAIPYILSKLGVKTPGIIYARIDKFSLLLNNFSYNNFRKNIKNYNNMNGGMHNHPPPPVNIKNFTDNLNLKDGTLFGYQYNILTYPLFDNKVRYRSNVIFKNILKLISVWVLFAKPIGTPWLLSSYINSKKKFKKLIENLSGNNVIWKYFTLGLDKSYFEEAYKIIKNTNDSNILSGAKHFLYTFIAFIILLPFIYFYNNVTFGLTSSPSWYNLIYQFVFIINIVGNIHNKDNPLSFNIKFFIAFIIIMIFSSIIKHLINKYK